jgi:hypothetical protein
MGGGLEPAWDFSPALSNASGEVKMRSIRLGIGCLLLAFAAMAQDGRTDCKDMTYEAGNPADRPFQVTEIRGTAQDAQGVPIDACVGIFREADHTLIAIVETDDIGHFEFPGIPDGSYRLEVKSVYTGFCPAIAKIQTDRHAKNKKSLVAQMRAAKSDTCSWIEFK